MSSPSESASPTTARPARLSRQKIVCLLAVGLLCLVFGVFIATKHFKTTDSKYQLLPAAVYYHRVKKGMPQEAVEHSCGRPEYVEQLNAPGDEAEAWFYSASDGQIQIDFDNGKVHKIHRD